MKGKAIKNANTISNKSLESYTPRELSFHHLKRPYLGHIFFATRFTK